MKTTEVKLTHRIMARIEKIIEGNTIYTDNSNTIYEVHWSPKDMVMYAVDNSQSTPKVLALTKLKRNPIFNCKHYTFECEKAIYLFDVVGPVVVMVEGEK